MQKMASTVDRLNSSRLCKMTASQSASLCNPALQSSWCWVGEYPPRQ